MVACLQALCSFITSVTASGTLYSSWIPLALLAPARAEDEGQIMKICLLVVDDPHSLACGKEDD